MSSNEEFVLGFLRMKLLLRVVFFIAIMLFLPSFAKMLTGGFKLAKLQIDLPFQEEWEVPMGQEVNRKLFQPFHYIGKGSQSYVFESDDQTIVIKLFRFQKPHLETKILTQLRAAHIAFQKAPEETGLLYIHLNQTDQHLPSLYCKDKVGRSYVLPLDSYRFAIQKKATPLKEAFEEALSNPILMQTRIDQLIELLDQRVDKQIINTDPSLFRNFGFVEDRAIEIDFGNYRMISSIDKKEEIYRFMSKLKKWLDEVSPEWADRLEERISSL